MKELNEKIKNLVMEAGQKIYDANAAENGTSGGSDNAIETEFSAN